MRNKFLIIFGSFCLIGLISFGVYKIQPYRLNAVKSWDVNLSQKSKDPYGLYIMYKEIGNLSNGKVKELDKISELEISPSEAKNYAVVVLSEHVYFDSITKNHFKTLVQNGGLVLISDYEDNSDDTIYTNTINLDVDFTLSTNEYFKIKNKRSYPHRYFDEFRKEDHQILGYLETKNKKYPNFLKYQPNNAKGAYLYHAEPLYFTNYYLLQEDSYFYAKSVLKELNGRQILWYNPKKEYVIPNDSMMRYILSQPALKTAWIILICMLFIYLFFRSRREQRIIPILTKEENHTVEFAKTISSLYQENGEVKDIISKKMDYFFYQIRKHFLIETTDLTSKHFIEIVAQKAGISQQECAQKFELLQKIQQKTNPTQHDLKTVHEIIENYKQKANI